MKACKDCVFYREYECVYNQGMINYATWKREHATKAPHVG